MGNGVGEAGNVSVGERKGIMMDGWIDGEWVAKGCAVG